MSHGALLDSWAKIMLWLNTSLFTQVYRATFRLDSADIAESCRQMLIAHTNNG